MSALEAAPKSLLGLEKRAASTTTPPGFAARNSNPELRHFPSSKSRRPFCTSSLSEWRGVDFLSSNVTKGGPGSVGFPDQNRMGRENGKYDTTHQDHNGGADEEAVSASVQHRDGLTLATDEEVRAPFLRGMGTPKNPKTSHCDAILLPHLVLN